MNPFFQGIQAPADGSFDMAVQVIPKNTELKGVIEESKWESFTNPETGVEQTFIKNVWCVVEGEYQNRKVFQKLHVQDDNQGKAQRSLQMLAAIDANAGGKIMAAGHMPDDMMLATSLCNVPMNFVVDVWSINGNEGNHITAVSPAKTAQQPMSQQQAINQATGGAPAQQPQQMNQMQPQQMNQQQLATADIDF